MEDNTEILGHDCMMPLGCKSSGAEGRYGSAIDQCCEWPNGEFWVNNGEYSNQVNFCPWCGAKAPVRITPGD